MLPLQSGNMGVFLFFFAYIYSIRPPVTKALCKTKETVMTVELNKSLEKLFVDTPVPSGDPQSFQEDYKLVKNYLTVAGKTAIDIIRALGYIVDTGDLRIIDRQFYRKTVMAVTISNKNTNIVFNIEVKREYTVKSNPLFDPNKPD